MTFLRRNCLWRSHPWHKLRIVWDTLVLKGDAKGTMEMSNGDAKVVMLRWLWPSGNVWNLCRSLGYQGTYLAGHVTQRDDNGKERAGIVEC